MFRIFLLFSVFLSLKTFAQEDFQRIVAHGLHYQKKADSLRRLVDIHTEALPTVAESSRMGIMIAIRDNDALAVEFQKLADEIFMQIVNFEKDTVIVEGWEPKFNILSRSPYSAANPIPIDAPLPDGIVYKIQMGAFGRAVAPNAFRGLTPVSGERLENGVTKYYVGLFSLFKDADEALRKVREYGFRDAFIVAFHNSRPITNERARQLE